MQNHGGFHFWTQVHLKETAKKGWMGRRGWLAGFHGTTIRFVFLRDSWPAFSLLLSSHILQLDNAIRHSPPIFLFHLPLNRVFPHSQVTATILCRELVPPWYTKNTRFSQPLPNEFLPNWWVHCSHPRGTVLCYFVHPSAPIMLQVGMDEVWSAKSNHLHFKSRQHGLHMFWI